ncbi:MAG: hypothetical protein NC080_08265 [Paraprevotella sp.]|nr:hypothetical protein [Paraprevotella sp.]
MRVEKSLKNVTAGLIGQVLTLFLGFVVRTVFIQQLGATYLGVSGLFSNILSILSFAELGFGQAIVFALYKPIADQDERMICSLMALFKKVYVWMFGIVLLLGLSLVPFLQFFVNDINAVPNLRIIYVMYVVSSATTYLFAYKSSFLIATQNSYVSTIIGYFFSIGLALSQVAVLLLTHDFLLFLGLQVISGILQNIAVARKTDILFPFLKNKNSDPLPPEDVDKIKKNVKALAIYKIGTLSLNSTDNIIMSKFVGLLSVGLYSNYYLLQYTVNGLLSTVFSNLTASIGNFNATESNENKHKMFKILNMLSYWCYTVCSVCLFICMSPFIKCWIGDDYLMDMHVSFVIAFNMYIAGMLFASFNYRQTMGLFTQGKVRPIISAIENIVVSLILVQYFGVAGVLWGTAITRLTTNAWYDPYIVFKKGLGVSPLIYFADYLLKLLVAIVAGAALYYICNMLPFMGIISVLIQAIISFWGINLILYAIFHRTAEVKYLQSVFSNMIVRKVKVKLHAKR